MTTTYMRPHLRVSYELLQRYRWGYLTNHETTVDKRPDGEVLLVNNATAGALVRRGLAEFIDGDDPDREADIISILAMPDGAEV